MHCWVPRNTGRKHAKRLAKGSGRQLCLSYFAVERFAVRNKGGEEAVKKLISETAIPTSLVETRERYGGLRYADARCWRFFSSIEYVFASIATADNFVACGGSIIKELTQALQCNKKYAKPLPNCVMLNPRRFSMLLMLPLASSICYLFSDVCGQKI